MAAVYTIDTVTATHHSLGHKFETNPPFDTYTARRYFTRVDLSGYVGGDATLYPEISDNAIRRVNTVVTGNPDDPPL